MPVETLTITRQTEPDCPLRDLDRVRLTVAVFTDDGDQMEAGCEGTVVGIWRGGAAYEVEFAEPPGALATVDAGQLILVEQGPA